MKTYWKVFNDTGGMIFWLIAFAQIMWQCYLWDWSDAFWTNFADLTSEEQKENAVDWMKFILGVVILQVVNNVVKREQASRLEINV